MRAALPMYDWPEVRPASDALWAAIRGRLARRGVDAPASLERDVPLRDLWLDPGLLLAQTCGLPFSRFLKGRVRLVGVPVYATQGCDARGRYSSAILVRRDDPAERLEDLAGRRFAFNEEGSQSGWNAMWAALGRASAETPFSAHLGVGRHRASMTAVLEGWADVCAVDAVCWGLARRLELPEAKGLRALAFSPMTMGLPLINAIKTDDATLTALRDAVAGALADPATEAARRALLIDALAPARECDYDPIGRADRRINARAPEPA